MTEELLARIAAAYGFASLVVVESLTSGGVNRSWHVEGDGRQQFFLKIFDAANAERGELEASILEHLNAHPSPAYRAQQLVCTRRGSPLFTYGESACLLTRWRSGSAKKWREFSSDDWRVLGGTLGALHARLRGLRLPALPVPSLSRRVAERDYASERDRIETHRRLAAQHESYPLRHEADAYFEQRLRLLDKFHPLVELSAMTDEQLIHNDYTEANFIFDERGGILIVDWERAIYAVPEYEVVRSLVIVPIVAPAHAARFVEEYQRYFPINRRRIRNSVGVYLIEQALKHWPTESWLRGEDWGRAHFESNFEIIDLLDRHADLLSNFYEDKC